MHIDAIKALCATVNDFTSEHDLRFKSMPIIELNFADMGAYFATRARLKAAIPPDMVYVAGQRRQTSPHVEEIEMFGVIFRLRCDEVLRTQSGRTVGAGDIPPSDVFEYDPDNPIPSPPGTVAMFMRKVPRPE